MTTPSPNGENGRDERGRFATGNTGGPGNPYARRVAELRRALYDSVTPGDLREVARTLLAKAKAGEGWAIRELFDRLGVNSEAEQSILVTTLEHQNTHAGDRRHKLIEMYRKLGIPAQFGARLDASPESPALGVLGGDRQISGG